MDVDDGDDRAGDRRDTDEANQPAGGNSDMPGGSRGQLDRRRHAAGGRSASPDEPFPVPPQFVEAVDVHPPIDGVRRQTFVTGFTRRDRHLHSILPRGCNRLSAIPVPPARNQRKRNAWCFHHEEGSHLRQTDSTRLAPVGEVDRKLPRPRTAPLPQSASGSPDPTKLAKLSIGHRTDAEETFHSEWFSGGGGWPRGARPKITRRTVPGRPPRRRCRSTRRCCRTIRSASACRRRRFREPTRRTRRR